MPCLQVKKLRLCHWNPHLSSRKAHAPFQSSDLGSGGRYGALPRFLLHRQRVESGGQCSGVLCPKVRASTSCSSSLFSQWSEPVPSVQPAQGAEPCLHKTVAPSPSSTHTWTPCPVQASKELPIPLGKYFPPTLFLISTSQHAAAPEKAHGKFSPPPMCS